MKKNQAQSSDKENMDYVDLKEFKSEYGLFTPTQITNDFQHSCET